MSRLALVLCLLLLPGAAIAQPAMGRSYGARHITLEERTFRIDLGPYERGINDSGTILGPFGSSYGLRIQVNEGPDDDDSHVGFGAGFAYGITDELEIGALLVPINTYGDDFGHITPYVRWAFVSTASVDVGLQAAIAIPTGENLGFAFGLPMNFRIRDRVRFETGVELETYFDTGDDDGTGDEAYLHLDIPFSVGIDVGRHGFLGPRLGVNVIDFDYVVVPVGAFGGFTFQGPNGNGGDLTAAFTYFIDEDDFLLPDFEFVFGGNFYFGL